MRFQNISFRIDEDPQKDCQIEMEPNYIVIHCGEPFGLYINKSNIVRPLPEEQGPTTVTFIIKGSEISHAVVVTFGSRRSKAQFLEELLRERNDDSGNDSPAMSTSSSD